MKKTILISLILLCALITLFFSSFKTSTQNENLIVVQICEVFASSPRIVVSDGKTIIRVIALEPTRDKNIESNILKIATTLNEIKNDGYSIITSSSANATPAGGNAGFGITTYVFEKK